VVSINVIYSDFLRILTFAMSFFFPNSRIALPGMMPENQGQRATLGAGCGVVVGFTIGTPSERNSSLSIRMLRCPFG
jgi:hypothetical protein